MSDCSYQAMGFKHCSKTPNLLQCHKCATRAGIVRAPTPTPETHVFRGPAPPVTPLMDHIAKLEHDVLDGVGVPGIVLMGTPSTSGMYFNGSPMPEWRREYMGQWVPHDERDHDAAALAGRRSGKTETLRKLSEPPAAACPGCAGLVFFTVNDCLQHHYHRDRTPCAWSGRQRATVEHEQRRMARPPKPPTLREWLGDRVGELGRWADVLREQPVPAGWIERWDWKQYDGQWSLYTWARGASLWQSCEPFRIVRAVTSDDGWLECLQMALFTHHPNVKPEPKPAAFPWDPYPEVV